MTHFDLPEECPNCGGLDTEDKGNGFFYCWDCDDMWNADDDVPPENDETLYTERLL